MTEDGGGAEKWDCAANGTTYEGDDTWKLSQ